MSERFKIGHKRGDWLRRTRCLAIGHDWETNTRGSQRVCYRCWTAENLKADR